MLDGQSLVDLPPHKRPTTTVFQHFALFPHRSVLDNVAFGLKMEGMGKERAARQGDGGARHGRAHRAPGPETCRSVRGPAAARRACARARDQAEGAASRRAARRPRPPAAAAHARRAAEPPAPTRADVHPRHAQPGRGPVDGRPDRGHERRPDPAGRRPADDRHEAGHGARRPLHGRQQHHQRQGDARARTAASSIEDEEYVRVSVRHADGTAPAVGEQAQVAIRAAAVEVGETSDAETGQLRSVRDRLRRVPRRPREAAPHRRRRADAGEGARRALSGLPGPGGRDDSHLLEGGGCPAPPPEGPEPVPHLDLAGHRGRRARRSRPSTSARSACSRRRGRRTRSRTGHVPLGAPGLHLARLLPDRSARLHRPDELLDAGHVQGLRQGLDVPQLRDAAASRSA